MEKKGARDHLIATRAARQHGVVSLAQLHDAGLGDTAISKRCGNGRLHRLHRGVYAVGHIAPSNERRWMAAVLALGGDAVLSHRSAAGLWEILPPTEGPVDISLPSRSGRRRRQGIRVHRPELLQPADTTRRWGIPVTSPARTLLDLKGTVSDQELRRAIRQADFLGLPTGPEIEVDKTRSELERRFLWLLRRHDLPKPAVNMRMDRLTVDFCWMEQKLIVETDGYQSHRGKAAFEDDRDRDLKLRALGFEVLRLSHKQVFRGADEVIAALEPLLKPSEGSPRGSGRLSSP